MNGPDDNALYKRLRLQLEAAFGVHWKVSVLSIVAVLSFGWLVVVLALQKSGGDDFEIDERRSLLAEKEWVERVTVVAKPSAQQGVIEILETIEMEVRGIAIKGGFIRPLPKRIITDDGESSYKVEVQSVSRYLGKCGASSVQTAETYPVEKPYRDEDQDNVLLQLGHRSESQILPQGRNCFVLSYNLSGNFWNAENGLNFRWPVNFSAGIPTRNAVFKMRFPASKDIPADSETLMAGSVIRMIKHSAEADNLKVLMQPGLPAGWSHYQKAEGGMAAQLTLAAGEDQGTVALLNPGDVFAVEVKIASELSKGMLGWG